jgi:hypothetical protein
MNKFFVTHILNKVNDDTMETNDEGQQAIKSETPEENGEKVQCHPKDIKSMAKDHKLKIPQLELRIFDHSFPYGLSLPSDVIKQVSLHIYLIPLKSILL